VPSADQDLAFPELLFRPEGSVGPSAGSDVGSPARSWMAPAPSGTSLAGLVRHAAARTVLTRRRASGASPRVVVPLRPTSLRTGARAFLRGALASGAVVLRHGSVLPDPDSILGRIAAQAQVQFPRPTFWLGSGGSLVAPGLRHGAPVVLRVFPSTMGQRHDHGVRTLEHLEAAHILFAPRLVAVGETGGTPWLLESRLAGRRPRALSAALARDVREFCLELPLSADPPTLSSERRLDGIDADIARRLRLAAGHAVAAWDGVRPVGVHGDLWTGNLLEDRGRLRGVVDWDAYRTGVVPGTDLVHLVATDERLRQRRGMGAELLSRPWRREPLRGLGARYFAALGLAVDDDRWTAAGIDWWIGQVADSLERRPELATSAEWVGSNVVAVLDALG
jgi:Phosphotransferase enzyme family